MSTTCGLPDARNFGVQRKMKVPLVPQKRISGYRDPESLLHYIKAQRSRLFDMAFCCHGMCYRWSLDCTPSYICQNQKSAQILEQDGIKCIHMSHMRAMSCSGRKSLSPAQSAGCQYSIWLSILVLFGTCHCSVIARNTRCPAGKALKRRWPVIKIDQTHESTSNRHRRTWQAGDLRPGKFLGIHGANWCKLVQHMGGHRTLVHLAGGATDSIARQALGRE